MSNANREVRVLASAKLENRADGGSEAVVLTGYAAVFGQETDIGGYFRERIEKGAFSDAISRDDIHALYNHDYQHVLGRAKAGTLRLSEDDHGLKVEITLPETQTARDLAENIRAGNIDQMSFAFTMSGGRQTWDESGETPLRTIEKVGELWEVSVVPRGAYPTTEIGLRSLEAHRKEARRHNFNAAARRLAMKAQIDSRTRGI